MTASKKLNIGLLLCDDVDPSAQDIHGTYTKKFQDGLDPDGEMIKLTPIRAFEGEALPQPSDFDGYVISGSRFSVYEDLEWIKELMGFVRECWQQQIKVVGICFGHQLIAHALGGRTEKADVGWGFGIHSTKIIANQSWMTDQKTLNGDIYNLIVIHQDQVVETPPHFKVIAESDFCPNSMMVAEDKMLGIQGHPEFSKEFCQFRADFRKDIIGPEVYQYTVDSLAEKDTHSPTILKWIGNFLNQQS